MRVFEPVNFSRNIHINMNEAILYCRYGNIVCFTEGPDSNVAICGLDVWDVRDAYGCVGDWWRLEAVHDTDIRSLYPGVPYLEVSIHIFLM